MNLHPKHAAALLLVVTIFWGTSFPFIKFLVPVVDPIVLMTYRFGIAAVLAALSLLVSGRRFFADPLPGLVSGILLWLILFPQMLGLRYTTASHSAFVTSLFVVFVPLFAFLIHRRLPSIEQSVAIVLAVSGLWGLTGGVASANFGDLLTLGSAFACGAYMVTIETYACESRDWLTLSFQQFLVVTIAGFIQVKFSGLDFVAPDFKHGMMVVYLAVCVTFVSLSSQAWAQRHVSSMKASIIFTLEPVVAALISMVWLGDAFSFRQFGGAVLIILALLVTALPLRRLLRSRSGEEPLRP